MKTYEDVESYLHDLHTNDRLAVISLQMAADALGLQRSTIDKRLKDGKLEGIKIGKTKCVTARSVNDELHDDGVLVARMEQYLARRATLGESIEYAKFMSEFGLDSNMTAHRNRVGRLLGKLSTKTFEEHGILLSILVVYKATGIPAESFFDLADYLEDPDYQNAETNEDYYALHHQKVIDHFQEFPQ